ncbi:MAG: translocation/assembly module TamB domain-containing protein [Halioglobus sp.]
MTRLQKTALAVLLALPLLLAVSLAAVFGLASSERGSRFLLEQGESALAEIMTWDSVEGSLLDALQLHGVRISQPGLDVEIDSLAIAWQPLALLGRVLEVSALDVHGLHIVQSESADTQASEPFDPASVRLPVSVQLTSVAIEEITVTDIAGVTQVIDRVSLQGGVEGDRVDLPQLTIEAPQGALQLQLQLQLNTVMPLELTASGRWQPDDFAQQLSVDTTVSGTLDWQRGTAFDLSYAVSAAGLTALSGEIPEQVTMNGALVGGYLDNALDVERFTLVLAETTLALSVSGSVSQLSTDSPVFALRSEWTGAQWPVVSPQAPADITSARGDITFNGVMDDYQIAFSAELAGAELPDSSWRGQGAGDLQSVSLQQLQGSLLGGQVTVTGPVWWEPLPRWQLAIDLANIDPGLYQPDFPGRLNGSLSTAGLLDAEGVVDAGVNVSVLTGELMGFPFELATQAQLQGEDVELTLLSLASGNNTVEATGQLSEQALDLAWQLQADDPGLFVTGASGALEASGTVRGTASAPEIELTASSRELALDSLSLFDLSIDAVAGMAVDDVLQLSVSTGSVSNEGEIVLNALTLQGAGTTGRHTLELGLDSDQGKVQSRLQGGITEDLSAWAGELENLALRGDAFGAWQLRAPSVLSASATTAELGNACLALLDSESALCVEGSWSSTGGSAFAARLESLSVAEWAPAVSGVVSGEMQGTLAADGQLRGSTVVRMSDGTLEVPLESGSQLLAHGGGLLEANIDQGGLVAQLEFDAPQEGTLQADLSVPQLHTLPLLDTHAVAGRVVAELPDLVGFAAWVPQVSSVAGALKADLALTGSIAKPVLRGEFVLTDGAADVPVAGISLRNIAVNAATDPSAPERVVLTGGLESGEGRLELSGEMDMNSGTADVNLTGDKLLVFNTRDAEVVLAPNIDIGWEDETLVLRGDISIPRANITPKLSLSQSAQTQDSGVTESAGEVVAASPDVVIVNGSIDLPDDGLSTATAAPVRIDSQLRLLLGERVRISSLGFISRITGNVLFTNSPDQVDLVPIANGSFSLEDGTFRAFGQDLEIEEGRILFADVPATEPELNLRAVRWIDNDPEVSAAGVLLTGPVTAPELELFSRPQLDASEIQSYLLTGRSAGDRDSVLSIGTYVSRRVYVGYGYNLLESTSEFNSLFNITPRYGVGANVGEADNNINVTFTLEH